MRSEDGFTLVELIAVIIILGIITTVVVVKFADFTDNASEQVINSTIAELNTREKHTWMNAKLEGEYENIDKYILERVDRQIGEGAMVSDTEISVRGTTIGVIRKPADKTTPAIWSRQ